MKIKVGDVVEFKKYEDLDFDETVLLSKDELPESGKVKKVIMKNEKAIYFFIEESPYSFGIESVARVVIEADKDLTGEERIVAKFIKSI